MTEAGTTVRRALGLILFAVVAASLVTGAYLLLERFLRDRQSAMAHDAPSQTSARRQAAREAARRAVERSQQRSPNAPPSQPPSNPGEAAIQRQLKALEEINRINEMNRRLQEQQRRMNHHDR